MSEAPIAMSVKVPVDVKKWLEQQAAHNLSIIRANHDARTSIAGWLGSLIAWQRHMFRT
jgi:hypothetical protein